MYKKNYVKLTTKICTVRFGFVERLKIIVRQVEPRWEGTEAFVDGTRALGLRTDKHTSTTDAAPSGETCGIWSAK